jgi:hypothetical protein
MSRAAVALAVSLPEVSKIGRTLGVCLWPDPGEPTAGPAGPLTEEDLPCLRSEWHGSF